MRRKDREYKVETNGVPDLTQAPKDLLELFCTAVLESILSETGEEEGTAHSKFDGGSRYSF